MPTIKGTWSLLIVPFGLIIGSFLNVVIYRGSAKYTGCNYKEKLNISTPKSSFCPTCLTTLKWFENIPLLSWIIQKGKCRHCQSPISIQYPFIEATNALLWLACYHYSPTIGHFIVGSLTISFLIGAAGIDIKTAKIPNILTLTGFLTILVLGSFLVPDSFIQRLSGAAVGFGIMFLIVELGKLLYGKKIVKMKEAIPFKWDQQTGILLIQDQDKPLEDSEPINSLELFTRKSDSIEIFGEIETNNKKTTTDGLRIKYDKTILFDPKSNEKVEVAPSTIIVGKIKKISFPREAMGMGDAKLMALVGASLGIIPTMYTILLAAIAGAIAGITLRLIKIAKKENPPNTMVFGPWLAAAAIALMFYYK
jgi:leader peptidase (prepilin peptidase)/N-methyltransferase